MAFQIQDDILDYMRTAHAGKPANNDLREGKITCRCSRCWTNEPERREELLGRLACCHDDEESVEYLQDAVETGAD